MKKILCIGLLMAFSISYQHAAVTINILAGQLSDQNSNPVPLGSLLVLVASTLDQSFSPIQPNAFASGDDIVIAQFATNSTPGTVSYAINNYNLSGNLNAGDPLALYWYPTLDINAVAPGFGTPYGMFTDPLGTLISTPFTVPVDGGTITYSIVTQNLGGSLANNVLYANLITIPEPSTYALIILGLGGLVWVMRRRGRVSC